MPSPFGTGARAESGIDGLANAAHTTTAPIMPSPIAIKPRTHRLEDQLNDLKISFHPLVDSGHGRPSAQHAGAPLNFEFYPSGKCRGVRMGDINLATVAMTTGNARLKV